MKIKDAFFLHITAWRVCWWRRFWFEICETQRFAETIAFMSRKELFDSVYAKICLPESEFVDTVDSGICEKDSRLATSQRLAHYALEIYHSQRPVCYLKIERLCQFIDAF